MIKRIVMINYYRLEFVWQLSISTQINFINAPVGKAVYVLMVFVHDATAGNYTITFGGTKGFEGGVAPVFTNSANGRDVMLALIDINGFIYLNTTIPNYSAVPATMLARHPHSTHHKHGALNLNFPEPDQKDAHC